MSEHCVRSILADWLRANGYDGLITDGGGCGCGVDDLMPCGEPAPSCRPAYVHRDTPDFEFYAAQKCGPGCEVCAEVDDG